MAGPFSPLSQIPARLVGRFKSLFPPWPRGGDSRAWREHIFAIISISSVVLGGLAYLSSVRITIQHGLWTSTSVYTVVYAVAIAVTLLRRIPYTVRAVTVVLLFYVLGVVGALEAGVYGSGRLWLFTFTIVTCLLLGFRWSLAALVLNVVTIITVRQLIKAGHATLAPWSFDMNQAWQALSVSFIMVCTVVTISLGVLLRGLESGLRKERTLAAELKGVNGRLKEEIEERRSAEEALRRSEERFRILNENAADTILLMDVRGKTLFSTVQSDRLLGLTKEQMMEKNVMEFIHPEDRARIQRQFRAWIEDGCDMGFLTCRLSGGTGVERHVEVMASNQLGNPAVQGVVLNIRDVTERRKAEEALKASEEKYRGIFEHSATGMFQFAADSSIINVNPAFVSMFRYASSRELRTELKNSSLALFEESSRPASILSLVTKNPSPSPREHVFKRKDGSSFPGLLNIVAVHDGSGAPPFVEGFLHDVTEQKHAEQERLKLEEQLRHAQKMEAVGTLAGGIAHDFNNLLQAISGYTQLLLIGKTETADDYNALRQIEKSCGRAGELTTQLLTFSRKVESRRLPLNLNSEVEQIGSLLKRTIPRMIDVHLDLAPDLKMTLADPTQIQQVMMNLGNNARDAMPDGGKLTFSTRNVHYRPMFGQDDGVDPGDYVELKVSDTGHGMDEFILEHIFEPFFTTKSMGGGTGLGLAMVYGIVTNHRGAITCDSAPGAGTTFTVLLPALDNPPNGEGERAGKLMDLEGGTETILIVEDEESILDLCTQALQYYGYHVLTARSGEEAIELYAADPRGIDLVILDLSMPGMGGHRCLGRLLALDSNARVMIASGYAERQQVQDLMEMGAVAFLSKPYDLEALVKTVRELIDGK